MNRIGSGFAVIFFAALICAGPAFGAETASAPLTVSQLITDPDKYLAGEIVVRGHIEISDLWRAMEAVHNLYESKAIVDHLDKDWKVVTESTKPAHRQDAKMQDQSIDAAHEMDELERKYCIAVSPVSPFLRNGRYLTKRAVVVRGRLIKLIGEEALNGCNIESHLILQVNEVLDPPSPQAKSK